MSYACGLDFGTTFTAAAVFADGALRTVTLGQRAAATPSMTFVRSDGSLMFGDPAALRGVGEPDGLIREVKRKIGETSPLNVRGRAMTVEAVIGDYLRWALDEVAAGEGGAPDHLVVTHPASWSSRQADSFAAALDAAGAGGATLVTEPYAAAAFHDHRSPFAVGSRVGVFDLGGGTFDAAVLERTADGFDLAGPARSEHHLGGSDLDDVMLRLVSTRSELLRQGATPTSTLRQECVLAKETLSSEMTVDVAILADGRSESVTVTRAEFEHLIAPAIDDAVGAFERTITAAGTTIDSLDAILLVGGSAQVPLVRQRLAEVAGGVELRDIDPRHAVARGAALIAGGSWRGAAAQLAPVAATATAGVPRASEAITPATAAPPPPTGPLHDPSSGERRRRRLPALVWVLVPVALVLGGLGVLQLLSNDEPETARPPAAGSSGGASAAAGDEGGVNIGDFPGASPVGMVEIPAGTYAVGIDDGGVLTATSRSVAVEPFYIDELEITNEQYKGFVDTQGAPEPSSWPGGRFPDELADHPVTGVSWPWAEAYCLALFKQLPTDAQWEIAARGPSADLYPWGQDASSVDVDTVGSHPGGSVENASAFGVFDTVASVWEWVREPYEPVGAGLRVRRGGENGWVRDGAAMRQAVEETNGAAIEATGFRCAAPKVDPATPYLEFTEGHVVVEASPGDGATSAAPADNVAYVDEFDDVGSGWFTEDTDAFRIGYHTPWFHLEASGADTEVTALRGVRYDDAVIETDVFVDATDTDAGAFEYGLAFRVETPANAADVVPPNGNPRPRDLYAFVIDPRNRTWSLLHHDSKPLRRVIGPEPLPPDVRLDWDAEVGDNLRVEMEGRNIRFFVDGVLLRFDDGSEELEAFDTGQYHFQGDVGFFVRTLDEQRAHVHFHRLEIQPR